MIAETIRKRELVTAWVERAGGVPQAIAELTRAFGLDKGDSIEKVEAEYFSGSLIPRAEWPALMQALEQGSAADKKHRDAIEAAHLRPDGRRSTPIFKYSARRTRRRANAFSPRRLPTSTHSGPSFLPSNRRASASSSPANSPCARATAARRCSPSPLP